MFDEINEYGEAVTHRYRCHNPICIREYWIGYINECPTCSFSGNRLNDEWPIPVDLDTEEEE